MNIKRKIVDFIIGVVLREIQVGGWCGLCGAWVPDCLVEHAWPYTICRGRCEDELS